MNERWMRAGAWAKNNFACDARDSESSDNVDRCPKKIFVVLVDDGDGREWWGTESLRPTLSLCVTHAKAAKIKLEKP